jgi:DNA-binding transcriptional LysR family regulator
MDAADLKVFEAVARLGGMNRAAAELNTVQSNVTARIRVLEDELRRPLFDRHSRGVSLTAAGRRLLPYAVRITQLLRDARHATQDDGTPKGSLTIGSLESTAAVRLSPVLTAYVAKYPQVDLVLKTGTTRDLIGDVLEHGLEGAFVCGPIDHPELETEVIVRENLVLLTSPAVISFDNLLNKGELKIIVLRAGCSYRQRLEHILAKRGVVAVRQLEFGTLEAVISCVAAGLGVTLLPRALIGHIWRDRQVGVHDLPSSEAIAETLFVRRRDGFISSALSAFLELVRPAQVRMEAAE